jgi:formiminotetrahydrofolate cyclodeaminase
MAIREFLPHCNDNITSDARVGIHQLAGAACSAYQTVLVNRPPEEEKERLKALVREIRDAEDALLELKT